MNEPRSEAPAFSLCATPPGEGGLLRRAARRVVRHRGEAAVVLVFLAAVTALSEGTAAFAHLAGALRGAPGVLGALVVAMALLWLPIAVIDARRCTRETALRAQVEADLEAQLASSRRQQHERDEARARVEAVVADRGLATVYQPIVDMENGRVVAYEALSRFPDSEGPDVWFERAASVGMGATLEAHAIRSALSGIEGLPVGTTLSLNASPDLLSSDEVVAVLCQRWPRRLAVEVTEHVLVENYHRFRETVEHLRRCGVLIVVDDAGAGYASFRHIVDLAPDVIKVDGSLVRAVDIDPARRSLMAAFVSFARDIGALLVAECVETQAEADELQRWGLRFGQGWLFGGPAPLAAAWGQSNRSERSLAALVEDMRLHQFSGAGAP